MKEERKRKEEKERKEERERKEKSKSILSKIKKKISKNKVSCNDKLTLSERDELKLLRFCINEKIQIFQ